MATRDLPLGKAALHPDWPEARFNVSGMFTHHPLLVQFLQMMKRGFDCAVPFEAIHGAPAMPWNAGRPSKTAFNPAELDTTLNLLHARNIGYFPTFTNHLIDQNDLADPVGNVILEIISRRPELNGVIITSELLSKYIAGRYPGLRQIASVTKVTYERGTGKVDYYRDLSKRFHRFVVDPDDSRNPQLMDQLDRDKTEIMVNENCAADRPSRAQHYDAYARWQKAPSPMEREIVRQECNQIVANCHSPLHLNRFGEHRRSCNLAPGELRSLYAMGFRHLKLQGRLDDPFSLAYDVIRFTCEPESVAPVMFKSMCRWLERAVAHPGLRSAISLPLVFAPPRSCGRRVAARSSAPGKAG